jgi:hypothetical protein
LSSRPLNVRRPGWCVTATKAQLGALAALIDWTSQMAGIWQSQFDHLEDLLKRMDQ